MENEKMKFSKVRFFIILILVLIGIGLCVELTYIFYKMNFLQAAAPSFCSVSDYIDCDGVAATKYSVSFGVPNAIWGLFVYAIFLMLLFVDRIQNKFKNTIFDVFKNPRSYITTIALLQFALSMILAYISITKINKICVLCFCTYFIDLFIAFAAMNKGFFIKDIITTIKDFISGAKQYFVLFLIVLFAFIGTLYYLDSSMIVSPKIKEQRINAEFFEAKSNKYAVKGNTLGKDNAQVVVKIYSDFNCPYCRVINVMIHKIAKSENIEVHEVNFPLDMSCNNKIGITLGGHETSCMYAKYALAAKNQQKFWGVANILYYNHPQSEDELISVLKNAHLGLDMEKLTYDANSPAVSELLQKDIDASYEKQIDGTPVIEINGVSYMGYMPYDSLVEKIQLAQKRANN